MTLAMPLVLLLGIVTFLLYRARGVRFWSGLVVLLFGFYLASSGAAGVIGDSVRYVVTGFFHH